MRPAIEPPDQTIARLEAAAVDWMRESDWTPELLLRRAAELENRSRYPGRADDSDVGQWTDKPHRVLWEACELVAVAVAMMKGRKP